MASKGNVKGMARWTTEGTLKDYRGGERFLPQWNARYSMRRLRMNAGKAVVLVEFEVRDKRAEIPYVCTRRWGKWKVSLQETMKVWEEGI